MNKEEILKKYVSELVNSPINLTAFKDVNLAYEFLVNDSIKPLKENEIGDNFLDVGTGGGVPGVFISVFFDKKGTLIDSSLKKISYVEKICTKLGIKNLRFLHGRIEEKKELREQFDSVVAKAVAELRILLELTVPFAKKGGKIFLYKGINYNDELEKAQNAIKELKIKLVDVRNYKILDRERFLLVFEKIERTEKKYPRKFSKIVKNPL